MKLFTVFTKKYPTETISSIVLYYSTTKTISGTVAGSEISVTPDTVGAAFLKVVTDARVYIEQAFVTSLGIGEIIKEETNSTDEGVAKLLSKWFSLFDNELYSRIEKKYVDLSSGLKEYSEYKMLQIIQDAGYAPPKEYVSMAGIKLMHSQGEKIEFNGEFNFAETVPPQIESLAQEVAELDSGTAEPVFEYNLLYLEGNRRSELGSEDDETLIPVAEIDSDD